MNARACFALFVYFFPLLVISCGIERGDLTYTYKYQTSDSVVAAGIDKVLPPIVTPSDAADYLGENSCLGYLGPIGPYGPLSSLGPIGSNSWNPSYWITGSGISWTEYFGNITGNLTSAGPLSSNGPLSHSAYYQDMPCINDFAANLATGGLWTVLGPLGPMGATGALGPLGPIGTHGFTADSDGQYRDSSNAVVRSISSPWNSTFSRTWDLYENYNQSFASTFNDNDCSFMVEGVVGEYGTSGDTYKFKSDEPQFVTILLVPLKQLDEWVMTVQDKNNNVISSVGPGDFVNWMQIKVPAHTKLQVSVGLNVSYHMASSDYRLFVSGSTAFFQGTFISGPHLISYVPV